MSFSVEEKKIMNEALNGPDCCTPSENSTSDDFELNIDSNAFSSLGEPDDTQLNYSDDLGIDLILNSTYPTNLSTELCYQEVESTVVDFSIFEAVERYEESRKERLEKNEVKKRKKFYEVFKPLACSTPISFECLLKPDEILQIDEICANTSAIQNPSMAINGVSAEKVLVDNVEPMKNMTTTSVALLKSTDWNIHQTLSIAPAEISRRTVATPSILPDVLVYANEYSASSSIMGKNVFFSQLQEPEKILRIDETVEKIENIAESLVEDLCCGNTLCLQIKRTHSSNTIVIDNILKMKPNERASFKTVNFHSRSASRFCLIVLLLGEAYKFLKTGYICNQREIFYRHTRIVRDMGSLERGIIDMCSLLGIARWEAGIVATSKGLVCGPLRIIMESSDEIDCGAVLDEGTLLPQNFTAIKQFNTTAKFIIVVEKDTVFERLLKDDIFSRIGTPFILVTGKGMPDTCTRFFLKKIWNDLAIPIYILVDADPYGIDIMLTYKHGSVTMCEQADSLAVPSIKWIGVHPFDLSILEIPKLSLTPEDRRKIQLMQHRSYVSTAVVQQLTILQENGVKAEIEGLYSISGNYFIDEYISDKIKNNLGF